MNTRKWAIVGGVIGALFGVLWGEMEATIEGKIYFIVFWAICGVVIFGINAAISKTIDWNRAAQEQESLRRKRATMTEEEKRREFFEIYGDYPFSLKEEVVIFTILAISIFIIMVVFGK